jgi:integrase
MRAGSSGTLRDAAEAWLEGVKSGALRNRSGHPYKPSAIRGYEASLVLRVLPALGGLRLSEVRRVDQQDFADRLCADGLDPSTVRNTLMPRRAIFRRAVARGEVAVNPSSSLELPAMEGARDRIASPAEAAELLAALPERDRALWATAMYAGLRRGELLALRWEDVDLAAGVIHVERSWDAKEGAVGPKSRAGRRTVPIPAVLRDHLVEHKLRSGRHVGLVFGTSYAQPFTPSNVRKRANAAWLQAGLAPIGLHECRHTFASLMIAAGVNAKSLSAYMGHSSVTITHHMEKGDRRKRKHEADSVPGLLHLRRQNPVQQRLNQTVNRLFAGPTKTQTGQGHAQLGRRQHPVGGFEQLENQRGPRVPGVRQLAHPGPPHRDQRHFGSGKKAIHRQQEEQDDEANGNWEIFHRSGARPLARTLKDNGCTRPSARVQPQARLI